MSNIVAFTRIIANTLTTCTFTVVRFGNGGILFCVVLTAVVVPDRTVVVTGCLAVTS